MGTGMGDLSAIQDRVLFRLPFVNLLNAAPGIFVQRDLEFFDHISDIWIL